MIGLRDPLAAGPGDGGLSISRHVYFLSLFHLIRGLRVPLTTGSADKL
jgi:hypothetical protein